MSANETMLRDAAVAASFGALDQDPPCVFAAEARNACMAAALLAAGGMPNALAQTLAAAAYAAARRRGERAHGEDERPPLDPTAVAADVPDGGAWALLADGLAGPGWHGPRGLTNPEVGKLAAAYCSHYCDVFGAGGFAANLLLWEALSATLPRSPAAVVLGLRASLIGGVDEDDDDDDDDGRDEAERLLHERAGAIHVKFWREDLQLYVSDAGAGALPSLAGNLLAALFDFRGARARAGVTVRALRESGAWGWGASAGGFSRGGRGGGRATWLVALQAWLAGEAGEHEERAALLSSLESAVEFAGGSVLVHERMAWPAGGKLSRGHRRWWPRPSAPAARNGPAAAALLLATVGCAQAAADAGADARGT